MTFAHQVKNEVCHNKALTGRFQRPFLYGMALFGKSFCQESISLSTEHKAAARLYSRMLFSQVPMAASVTTREYIGSFEKSTYIVTVDDQDDRCVILEYFNEQKAGPLFASQEHIYAFLAGALLSSANITDPKKDYHLEFCAPKPETAAQLARLLERLGLSARQTVRRGQAVVYIKDSKSIENLLAMVGAHKAVMEMMNVKIYKDMRNQVNRVTNCETSNIVKSMGTATVQIADIHFLQEQGRLEGLPVPLKEAAAARLENPESSLRELAEVLGISRSGINHRLRKISDIAKEVRGEVL